MQILVSFKNVKPSVQIKNYFYNKMDRLKKIIHRLELVHVIFRLEKMRHIVEVNLIAKNMNVHASEDGMNFNESIDLVLKKIRKQIVKNKEKFENRKLG